MTADDSDKSPAPSGNDKEPSFLAEYWLWILLPLVLILGALLYITLTVDDDSGFVYGIY